MNQKFIDYYHSIGIKEPLVEKVQFILNEFSKILPENDDIIETFVEDFINQEETRQYSNLMFFTNSKIIDSTFEFPDDEYKIAVYKKNISTIQINKFEYNFGECFNESRMNIAIKLKEPPNFNIDFKATRNNCKNLFEIYNKIIIKNLI